jgi:peptide deformylase
MSEVLTINTEENSLVVEKPLVLYNEKNLLLKIKSPSFDFANPPIGPHLIAKQLHFTMKHYGGVGLAANQVGWNYRVFVLEGGVVCFNPKIISASEIKNHDQEGCLSFPGLLLRVYRSERVAVEYQDANGNVHQNEFMGMTARCFQHELDHLNGIVYTDLVGNLTLQMARKKQQKLFKKIERIQTIKTRYERTDSTVKSDTVINDTMKRGSIRRKV